MTEPISAEPSPSVSVQSIALKIGRHFTSVKRSIERLGITPVAVAGTHKFYHPDVADQVSKNLRKANQSAAK